MEVQTKYCVEDVVRIVMTLSPSDRDLVQQEIQKTLLDKEEAEFDNLIKEDFEKYEATFKALA